MKFLHIKMHAKNLLKLKEFYTEPLSMNLISEDSDSFTVQSGKTLLTFTHSEKSAYYHLCFRVNEFFFDMMAERLPLLSNEQGEEIMDWKGKQAYFYDSEGNILEMVVREEICEKRNGWFDVSEVGMPCTCVKNMQEDLNFLKDIHNGEDRMFSFYGDHHGSFVLVNQGRPWFPTQRGAEIHPLEIEIEDRIEIEFVHPVHPYKIKAKKRAEFL